MGMRPASKNAATHQRPWHVFAPVVRHPRFPAAIGLWFATLFGLTTLALPAKVVGMAIGTPTPAFAVQFTLAASLAALAGFTAFQVARRKLAPPYAAGASQDDEKEISAADAFAAPSSPVLSERSVHPLDLDSLFATHGSFLPNVARHDATIGSDPAPDLDLAHGRESQSAYGFTEQAAERLHTPGRSPVADAPLASLGVVELLERLAFALDEWHARNPGGQLPDLPGGETLNNLTHLSQWFNDRGCRTSVDEVGRAIADGSDEYDFDPYDDESADTDDASDEQSDDRYASLVDMTARARMRPQSESEPSGHASLQDGSQVEEADHALQAALAQLERLSLRR